MEVGRWKLEDGRWEMEVGRWKMGDGSWEMEDFFPLPASTSQLFKTIIKMSLRDLKSHLQKESKQDLIKHIAELYKKYKPVKEYFSFYINPDEKALLEEYKLKVYEGFFPARGYDIKLSVARKAINAFKKLGASEEKQIELALYFVQCGVDCLNDYGDLWEAFYDSIANAFDKAMKKAAQIGILDKIKPLAHKIYKEGQDMGWGFSDFITHVYFEHYPDSSE